MANKTAILLPQTNELLIQFGERLRVARLRRRLSAKQVAQRSGMAPMTLRSLEKGGSGVTMGAYLAVMQVLGLEKDLSVLGEADPVGRARQDAQLRGRKSTVIRHAIGHTIRGETALPANTPIFHDVPPTEPIVANSKYLESRRPLPVREMEFINVDALVALIKPVE